VCGNDPVVRRPRQWVIDLFDALARWRSGRAVHPHGMLFDARVAVTDRESITAGALGGTGERSALVRVSPSMGTPRGMPDLLGIALRVALDDAQVLDVLFARVGRHRLTRLLLVPAAGWCRGPYSTVLPYVVAGRHVMLGLDPVEPGRADAPDSSAVRDAVAQAPVAFTVTEQSLGGRRHAIGRLVLESVASEAEPVSFDPVLNAHPQLRPARLLSGLRERAYTGSRRGRHADPGALHRSP
jgi:hypothetical protein